MWIETNTDNPPGPGNYLVAFLGPILFSIYCLFLWRSAPHLIRRPIQLGKQSSQAAHVKGDILAAPTEAKPIVPDVIYGTIVTLRSLDTVVIQGGPDWSPGYRGVRYTLKLNVTKQALYLTKESDPVRAFLKKWLGSFEGRRAMAILDARTDDGRYRLLILSGYGTMPSFNKLPID